MTLIYSKTLRAHVTHVDQVLQLLVNYQLFLNRYKCAFGVSKVEYLGHIFSHDGVHMHLQKIEVMNNYPNPKTLKILRGFLGLTGYCKNFIRNYGKIASPIKTFHKNNSFTWNDAIERAFQDLKNIICTTTIVTLPDFTKTFVLECDTYSKGIEEVLMQEGQPMAFTRKKLCERHLGKSTYEKEMMAILHVMDI
jgi:hypothetical protein